MKESLEDYTRVMRERYAQRTGKAVRLMRSFDLFATLPVELARLSLLLHRSGDLTAAAAATTEAANLAGHPVFTDATGDGSLGGVGDRLFTDTDGGGAGDLLATKGEAPFGLLVYPPAKIPAEGIRLRVEVKVGAQWVVFAEDRIIP